MGVSSLAVFTQGGLDRMRGEPELFKWESAMSTPAADQPASQAHVPTPLANPIEVPTPLAKELNRAGMVYWEFWRSGNVAIYCAKGRGSRIEYEVFEVQILSAGELNGRRYPLRESLPSNSSWGESGWTFTNNSHRDPLAATFIGTEQIANDRCITESES
jgi:hypothetical protein